ncbi:MAG TPA: sigma-70 family RNA polymerase sigma factor [Fimbriiglobus sp.]|jgi:RNA polymerase sigma-70 factor (ECF subfamily)
MTVDPHDDLLDRVNRGETEAAEALFRAYTPYLRAIVRRHLSDRLRPQFDSIDVVQSVWVQVVRQLGKDGWKVDSESQLRGLLATIARRRLVSRVRRTDDPADVVNWDDRPQDRYSTPSETIQAEDVWTKLLRLCPPDHQAVLRLKRQGVPLQEIARRTGLHEGSVRRILRRLARDLAMEGEPQFGPAE